MTLSELREYFIELISENGFESIYGDEPIKKVFAVRAKPSVFNPFKLWLKGYAKDAPGGSAAFIDEWVAHVLSSASVDGLTDAFKFEVGDHVEVARALNQRIQKTCPGEVVFDLNGYYQYQQGAVWERLNPREFTQYISEFSGSMVVTSSAKATKLKVSNSMIDGAIRIFKDHVDKSSTDSEAGFFDSAPAGIMFSDVFCRVDVKGKTLKLEAPSKGHRQVVNAGCTFHGTHDAPRFDAYWASVFKGDPDADKKVRILLEFAGACLANLGTRMQRAFLLYDGTEGSEGSNGKSLWIKVLNAIFPASVTSSISPTEFSEKFTRAMLHGKRINFVTEMPDEHGIISGESTKAVISGEPIKAEHKNQKPFFFSPTAGHLFACNDFPSVSDNSDAFWRRWVVVPFNNTFGPGESDPDLLEKIVTEERDAILRRIAHALGDLIRRGNYDVPGECEAAAARWRRETDSVMQFICEESTNYRQGGYIEAVGAPSDLWMASADIYAQYKQWAQSWGLRAYGKNRFDRRCTNILEKRRTSSGTQYRINFKDIFYPTSYSSKMEIDPF